MGQQKAGEHLEKKWREKGETRTKLELRAMKATREGGVRRTTYPERRRE